MPPETPTSLLDQRLDSSCLELKVRLGTDENCYDICVTGIKRRELSLTVTWCGDQALEPLKTSISTRTKDDSDFPLAAHQARWPVVYRDRAKAFALAFRRAIKAFKLGKVPGAKSAPAARAETVQVRRFAPQQDGVQDLPYDAEVLTEVLAAVQHVFGLEIPPAAMLENQRLDYQQQQILEAQSLTDRLAQTRAEVQQVLQTQLAERAAKDEAAKLFKTGRRNGPRLMIDGTRAADKGPVNAANAAELLRRLSVGDPVERLYLYGAQEETRPYFSGVEPWCRALAGDSSMDLSALTHWAVDSFDEPLTRTAGWLVGDITPVFERAPALSNAFIVGVSYLSRLNHPSLQTLALMTDTMEAKTVKAVFAGGAPKLRCLSLGLAYARAADTAADEALVVGFGGDQLPCLTELHVAYPSNAAGVLEGLMEAAAFSKLTTFSISSSGDAEALADVVLARPEAFAHLNAFHLPALPPESYEQLKAAGVTVEAPHNAFDPSTYGWQAFTKVESAA